MTDFHKGFVSRLMTFGWTVLMLACLAALPTARPTRAGQTEVGPCPANLAGRFNTVDRDFSWYEYFGQNTFSSGESAILDLAVVPFESGRTSLTLDENGGRTGFGVTFYEDGTVNHVVPYVPNAWNSVRLVMSFGDQTYTLNVNGQISDPIPFNFSNTSSLQSIRWRAYGAAHETHAWVDSLTLRRSSGSRMFAASFDDGSTYPITHGVIDSTSPPDTLPPAPCDPPTDPILRVSPGSLVFLAVQGQSNPPSQTLSITNTGAGSLSWTAAEGLPWLSLSASSGAAPSSTSVSVDATGLSPGTYSGDVTFTSGGAQGSPRAIHVTFLISPSSASQVGPCPAGLAGKLTAQGAFQWYEYFGGHSIPQSDSVVFAFVVDPFPSGQTYIALDQIGGTEGLGLTFSNGLLNNTVPYTPNAWNSVRVVLNYSSHTYTLNVNGHASAPLPFNTGGVQAMRIHVFQGSGVAWIDSITLTQVSSGGSSLLFSASFDDGSVYQGFPGLIQSLPPPSNLPPAPCEAPASPILHVSPDRLIFTTVDGEGNPANRSLSITNTGVGSLSWTASESLSWLSLDHASGSAPGEVDAHVDVTGLSPGTYSGTVTVTSAGAQGSPRAVSVVLLVSPSTPSASGPCPSELAGKLTTQDGFQWYEYFGPHEMSSGDSLILEFVVDPFEVGTTYVGLDEIGGRSGYGLNFTNGLVNGAVPYTADAWNSVRAVFDFASHTYALNVNGHVSAPIPFSFGDSSSVQSLRVHSFGTHEQTTAWMDSLSVIRSSEGVETTLFRADFDDGAVYEGYPGTIESLPPPSDLPEPPNCDADLQLDPPALVFTAVEGGSDPAGQSVIIDGGGSGSGVWTASESLGWLNLSQASGPAPGTLVASASIGSLPPGVYSGQVEVSDGGGSMPRHLNVSLVVQSAKPAPILNLTWNSGKVTLAWSGGQGMLFDVATRRTSNLLNGGFSDFFTMACGSASSSLDVSLRGSPPAGSVDYWMVRQRSGSVQGTWDEGGAQVGVRSVPPCSP